MIDMDLLSESLDFIVGVPPGAAVICPVQDCADA